MAVEGNVRVANAARTSFKDALRIAYRTGTITGMLTDGLGLLGGTIIFMVFANAAPDALLGFGFGGTLVALFMRVGGGIFTKAADVGADLVGKIEQDMPEDDPRNAAVIADLVGDNVGDCAGMAADIFESYEVTIVSGLILGVTLALITGHNEWILYPLLVRDVYKRQLLTFDCQVGRGHFVCLFPRRRVDCFDRRVRHCCCRGNVKRRYFGCGFPRGLIGRLQQRRVRRHWRWGNVGRGYLVDRLPRGHIGRFNQWLNGG